MADKNIKLIIEAVLKDKGFQAGVKGMGTQMTKTGKIAMGFSKVLGALGLAGGLMTLVGVMKKAMKTQMEFEQSIANVASVSGDANKVLAKIAETNAKFGFTAKEAGDAMYFLASSGMRAKEMATVLEPTLALAAAAQMGIAEATDIVVNNLKVFATEGIKAQEVVDIMAQTVRSSNTNMQQMGEAAKYAGSEMSLAGVKFQDMAATIGAMANMGYKGSESGAKLRMVYARLGGSIPPVTKALKKYGITQDEINKLLPTPLALFKKLKKANISNADATQIFGVRNKAVFKLIRDGLPDLKKLMKGMEGAGGAAKKMADIQLNTLQGRMKELKVAYEKLILVFSETGELKGFVKTLTQLIKIVQENAKAIRFLAREYLNLFFGLNHFLALVQKITKLRETRQAKAMQKRIRDLTKEAIAINENIRHIKKYGQNVHRLEGYQKRSIKVNKLLAKLTGNIAIKMTKNQKKRLKELDEEAKKHKATLGEKKDVSKDYYDYITTEQQKALDKENEAYKKAVKDFEELWLDGKIKSFEEYRNKELDLSIKHEEKINEIKGKFNLAGKEADKARLAEAKKNQELFEKGVQDAFLAFMDAVANAVDGTRGKLMSMGDMLKQTAANLAASKSWVEALARGIVDTFTYILNEFNKVEAVTAQMHELTIQRMENVDLERENQQIARLEREKARTMERFSLEESNYNNMTATTRAYYDLLKAEEDKRYAEMDADEKKKYDLKKQYDKEKETAEKAADARIKEAKLKRFKIEKEIESKKMEIDKAKAISEIHKNWPMPWDADRRRRAIGATRSMYDDLKALIESQQPAFAQGTESVPNTGTALVHAGERIIPAGINLPGINNAELIQAAVAGLPITQGGGMYNTSNTANNNNSRSMTIENITLPNVTNSRELLLELQEVADGMGTGLLNN